MQLHTPLPAKYLTEENPVIGLSFEVGYARMIVMVGESMIFTMSNMIRTDCESQIYHCPPAVFYYHARRMDIHPGQTALMPKYRSAIQHTGREGYEDFNNYSARLLELRRERKATSPHPTIEQMDRMHALLNSPYLYQNVGTVGHINYDKGPSYLTQTLYEREKRRAAVEAGFGELDYMQRKLLNNGLSGTAPLSGHLSMTTMCKTTPKFKLTNTHSGRGVVIPVNPSPNDVVCYKAGLYIGEKYYFTGAGMLNKGL